MTSKKDTEIIIPKPEIVGVGSTDDGLVTVTIKLRKFELTVTEANVVSRSELNYFVTELMKDFDDSDGYKDIIRRNMLTEVWAPLSVCSSGNVPDRDQFFHLPEDDLAFWVNTAKKLGHSFAWLDGLNRLYEDAGEPDEDVKKKSRVAQDHPKAEKVPAG